MAGEMIFSYRDLYPNMGYEETSTKVNPEEDDREALNEEVDLAEKSSKDASTKNILISIGIIVALVIFLGGAK